MTCKANELPLIRVVDDEEAVRDALVFLFSQEVWQTTAYPDATSFLKNDAPSAPGCLVLDVKMPGMSGLELQQELKRRGFTAPIIFLSGHGDIDMAVHTMHFGAFDFIPKPIKPERLVNAVSRAIEADHKNRFGLPPKEEIESRISQLTTRERQILKLSLSGLSNGEVGERLGLSEKTIENHKSSVFKRLSVSSIKRVHALFAKLGIEL